MRAQGGATALRLLWERPAAAAEPPRGGGLDEGPAGEGRGRGSEPGRGLGTAAGAARGSAARLRGVVTRRKGSGQGSARAARP